MIFRTVNPMVADQARALYAALGRGGFNVKSLAAKLGISWRSLYRWADFRSGVPIPAWAAAEIYRNTGDLDLWCELTGARALGFTITPPIIVTAGVEMVKDAALEISSKSGEVAGFAERALADARIDAAELHEGTGLVHHGMRAFAWFRHVLDRKHAEGR